MTLSIAVRTTCVLTVLSSLLFSCGQSDSGASRDLGEPSALVRDPVGSTQLGYVPAEFMSVEDVDAALPMLASKHVDLVWAWPADVSESELMARLSVVRRGEQLGIEVRPWLTLPQSDGYWPGASNAEAFDTAARALLQAWLAAGLKPNMLLVDMEMPLQRALEFVDIESTGDAVAMTEFLARGVDRTQYAAATKIYADLVDHAHELGFKVEISTLSTVLDDMDDGDDGLRQGFGIPFDHIDWDLCTFQIYRTMAGTGTGLTLDASYVYDYALRIKLRFGERAGIVVGLVDPGGLGVDAPVYDDPSQAAEDVAAARVAGLSRRAVGLYQLRGIMAQSSPDVWFAPSSKRYFNPVDSAALLIHGAAAALDLTL